MIYSWTLHLAWNEIEANEAAFGEAGPALAAERADAVAEAQRTSDAMRQHVWDLCAEAVRHAARARTLAAR